MSFAESVRIGFFSNAFDEFYRKFSLCLSLSENARGLYDRANLYRNPRMGNFVSLTIRAMQQISLS